MYMLSRGLNKNAYSYTVCNSKKHPGNLFIHNKIVINHDVPVLSHTVVQQNEDILAIVNNENGPRSKASNHWLVPTLLQSCFGPQREGRTQRSIRGTLKIDQVMSNSLVIWR